MTDITNEIETKDNPIKRKAWKRRTALYFIKAVVIIACLCDWYFEKKGIPRKLQDYVEKKLQYDSFSLTADKIYIGLINGIVFANPKLVDRKLTDKPILTASAIKLPLYNSLVPLKSFIIEGGDINIPLFPETGDEGAGDMLSIRDIDASVEVDKQNLEILYASCKIKNVELNASGILNNIISQIISINKKNKNEIQAKTSFLTLRNVITNIPYDTRSMFYKFLMKFDKSHFPTPLSSTIHIERFNMLNYRENDITVMSKAMNFSYGTLPIQKMISNIHIKNSYLNLESINVNFDNLHKCQMTGVIDISRGSINGNIDGSITPKMLSKLMPNNKLIESKLFNFNGTDITFNSNLTKYSYLTGIYEAKLNVEVPSITISGNNFTNIHSIMTLRNDEVICDSLTASLDHNGTIEANFTFGRNKLQANAKGDISFSNICSLINKPVFNGQLDAYGIKSDDHVKFSSILNVDPANRVHNTSIKFSIPQVTVGTIPLKNIETQLSYDGELITVNKMNAELANGTKLRTAFSFSPKDKTVVTYLVSQGNPIPLLDQLPNSLREKIDDEMQLFKLPDNPEDVDITLNAYVDWSDDVKASIYGDIVLNNFAVKQHTFKYGASTFLANYKDSRWNMLLPVIMLERPEGQATMSLAFTERDDTIVKGSHHKQGTPIKDFDFNIDSTLEGNVVLDLFVRNWDKDVVNFPQSTIAKVEGTLDYIDDDKDNAEIKITDADYFWDKIEVKHVSTTCLYKYRYLQVIDATGKVSGGDIVVNNESWFNQDKSKTTVSIKNANFTDIIKQYDVSLPTGKKPGKLTLNIKVDGKHPKDKKPEFYGSGDLKIIDIDLWSIPVLSSLQSLIDESWSLNKFGKITSLESKFTIDNDHIHTDSIETNGNIFSLTGKGDYYWESTKHSFTVQVKVLKNALPFKLVSFAFSPLSWFFEAQLTGDKNSSKWESKRKKQLFKW